MTEIFGTPKKLPENGNLLGICQEVSTPVRERMNPISLVMEKRCTSRVGIIDGRRREALITEQPDTELPGRAPKGLAEE